MSRGGYASPDTHPAGRPHTAPPPHGSAPGHGTPPGHAGPPSHAGPHDGAAPHHDNGPSHHDNGPGHHDNGPGHHSPDADYSRPGPDTVHQRHAESTPSGTSYHRGDPEMGDLPQRVRPDPDGRYTVDVHVTPDGRARVGGHTYSPEEFADILRRDPNYDGRPIRLIGCDAGSNDFANRLSNDLNTPVTAPTRPAWTDSDGRVFSSDYEIGPDGRPRPRIPPNGEWNTHHPDGSTTRAGDDPFAPGTPDADHHDLDPDDSRARGDGDGDTAGDQPQTGPRPDERYDPVPRPERIPRTDPRHDELFVDWDRPNHVPGTNPPQPIRTHEPPIEAPHRDRPAVPDGNAHPDRLRPDADPNPVPVPLRGHEPLQPHTAYPVHNQNGTTTTFTTDGDGNVRWVEATPGSRDNRVEGHGEWSGFNPDLGYPLLPDVQYRVPNFNNENLNLTFHTDSHGQPDAVTGDVQHGGQSPEHRDDDKERGAQRRAQMEGEAAHPTPQDPDHGLSPEELERTRVKYAGGHLVANELGGLGEYLNMHPQMAASNSGNYRDGWVHDASWRKMEKDLGAISRSEGQDIRNYQVRMNRGADGVPPSVEVRWQEVTYRCGPDGKPLTDADGNKIVESVETYQRDFPNEAGDPNYGPQNRFAGR